MLTMFRVKVRVLGAGIKVWNDVIEQKVHSITDKYVTFDEGGTKVRVPRSECFETAEEAVREAESQAHDLIAQLQLRTRELQEPAKVRKSPGLAYALRQTEDGEPLDI